MTWLSIVNTVLKAFNLSDVGVIYVKRPEGNVQYMQNFEL